jgi:hypothetical protein
LEAGGNKLIGKIPTPIGSLKRSQRLSLGKSSIIFLLGARELNIILCPVTSSKTKSSTRDNSVRNRPHKSFPAKI